MENEKDILDVFDEAQINYCIEKFKCNKEDLLEAAMKIGNKMTCLELYLQMNNRERLEDNRNNLSKNE